MVDQVITKQELIDAQKDAQALDDIVNKGPEVHVKTRLGRYVWTLATLEQRSLLQINEWQNAITLITANDGVPALAVADASGKTQQEINDFGGAEWRNKPGGYKLGATVKLSNGDTVKSTVADNIIDPNVDMAGWIFSDPITNDSPDAYKRPLDPDDTESFKRFVAKNPNKMILRNRKYIVKETITLPESIQVVEGNGATFEGDVLPMRPPKMLGFNFSSAVTKDAAVLPLSSVTGLSVGDKVYVWLVPSISPYATTEEYFQVVQYDTSITWRTAQVTFIKSIDAVNKTITVQDSTITNSVATIGGIYKVTNQRQTWKDIDFIFTNAAAASYTIDFAQHFSTSGLRVFQKFGGQVTQDTSFLTSFSLNNCYDCHNVAAYVGAGTRVLFSFGCLASSISYSEFDTALHSDGSLTIYAGCDNVLSFKNKFRFKELYRNGVLQTDGAGLYIGAKNRNCVSFGDEFVGYFIPIRVMFGPENCVIDGAVTTKSRQLSMTISVAHELTIRNCNLDRHIYAVFPDKIKIINNVRIGSDWVDGATTMMNAITLVPNPDAQDVALKEVVITGNRNIVGAIVINAALDDPLITGNKAATLTLYPNTITALNKKGIISQNSLGGIAGRGVLGLRVFGNNIDDTNLRGLTNKRTSGITLFGQAIIFLNDNTINAETLGIESQSASNAAFSSVVIEGCNSINAPTKRALGTTPRLLPAHADYLGLSVVASSTSNKHTLRAKPDNWQLVDLAGNEVYNFALSSFPATANGDRLIQRTITGLAITDTTIVSAIIADPTKGYISRWYVSAVDTLNIYYRDISGTSDNVSVTLKVTVIK